MLNDSDPTFLQRLEIFIVVGPTDVPAVELYGDPIWFEDHTLVDAARPIARLGSIRVGRCYEFGPERHATVIVILVDPVLQLGHSDSVKLRLHLLPRPPFEPSSRSLGSALQIDDPAADRGVVVDMTARTHAVIAISNRG